MGERVQEAPKCGAAVQHGEAVRRAIAARRRARRVVSCGLLAIALAVAGAAGRGRGEAPRATAYRVQRGDNLWRLVDSLPDASGDRRELVWMLKAINGLSSAPLHVGQRLLLPADSRSLALARRDAARFRATAVTTQPHAERL